MDMGHGDGTQGGTIVAHSAQEEIYRCKKSITEYLLKRYMELYKMPYKHEPCLYLEQMFLRT